MFNHRYPTQEEMAAQYNALVEQLAKIGLSPEDVPRALHELQQSIHADLVREKERLSKLRTAAS